MSSRALAAVLAASAALASVSFALAGGSGGGVLLVVNSDSWASLTVANHYAALRGLPACNIVSIPFDLQKRDDTADIDTFREKILRPVLKHIEDNRLDRVDYIVYSSDFPTAIDCGKDMAPNVAGPAKWALASINGLTFLHEIVMRKDASRYLDSKSNYYFCTDLMWRKEGERDASAKWVYDKVVPPRAFSSRVEYDDLGEIASKPAEGRKYHLSMMLGLTSGRGNSVSEVVACLKRAASADATHPAGRWYYMSDGGIRTETRKWGFEPAIARLKSIGQGGEVINYVMPKDREQIIAMPRDKDDIIGAMLGQQFPNPPRSGSKTLPGAIVENLTSEGGIMNWGGGQAPISDFIRFGAAGTSGTVVEPTALQWKFPTPFLFYYYAMGATLAESFYQSVQGPFQLLIVGDGLCQPFARLPRIDGPPLGLADEKAILAAKATAPEGEKIARVEFFLDGKTPIAPREPLAAADGYHEIIVSAACEGPMQWRQQALYGFVRGKAPQFIVSPAQAALGQTVKLKAAMSGARKIEFLHLGRVIGGADGDKAEVDVDSLQLGMGPVRLWARAHVGDAVVTAPPVDLIVTGPQPIPAAKAEGATEWSAGALLTGDGVAPTPVMDMRKRNPLAEAKIKPGAAFAIAGWVDAPDDDVYQFQVWYDGKLSISIDGRALALGQAKGLRLAPVAMAKGPHRFVAEGVANANLDIDIRFGGPGSRSLGDKNCRYPSAATRPAATAASRTEP